MRRRLAGLVPTGSVRAAGGLPEAQLTSDPGERAVRAIFAQRAAALTGQLYATKKPDKDNIEKAIADALNGVAWFDDAQISGGGTKRYGSPERVDVTIEELDGIVETPGDIRRKNKFNNPQYRF